MYIWYTIPTCVCTVCAERTRGLGAMYYTNLRSRASCRFWRGGIPRTVSAGQTIKPTGVPHNSVRTSRPPEMYWAPAEAVWPWRREGVCAVLAFAAVRVRIRIDCVYVCGQYQRAWEVPALNNFIRGSRAGLRSPTRERLRESHP